MQFYKVGFVIHICHFLLNTYSSLSWFAPLISSLTPSCYVRLQPVPDPAAFSTLVCLITTVLRTSTTLLISSKGNLYLIKVCTVEHFIRRSWTGCGSKFSNSNFSSDSGCGCVQPNTARVLNGYGYTHNKHKRRNHTRIPVLQTIWLDEKETVPLPLHQKNDPSIEKTL